MAIALATVREGRDPYKTRPRLVLSRWVCAYGLLLAAGAFVIAEIRHINPIWIFLSLISIGFIAFAKEEYRTEFRSVASQGSISSRRIASKLGPVPGWCRSAVESYPWSPSHDQCGMLRPFGTSSAEWW
jgi:hypothetical protein